MGVCGSRDRPRGAARFAVGDRVRFRDWGEDGWEIGTVTQVEGGLQCRIDGFESGIEWDLVEHYHGRKVEHPRGPESPQNTPTPTPETPQNTSTPGPVDTPPRQQSPTPQAPEGCVPGVLIVTNTNADCDGEYFLAAGEEHDERPVWARRGPSAPGAPAGRRVVFFSSRRGKWYISNRLHDDGYHCSEFRTMEGRWKDDGSLIPPEKWGAAWAPKKEDQKIVTVAAPPDVEFVAVGSEYTAPAAAQRFAGGDAVFYHSDGMECRSGVQKAVVQSFHAADETYVLACAHPPAGHPVPRGAPTVVAPGRLLRRRSPSQPPRRGGPHPWEVQQQQRAREEKERRAAAIEEGRRFDQGARFFAKGS